MSYVHEGGGNVSCKGCGYAIRLDGDWCCDYLGITGHRRPCPPGADCTVRTEAAARACAYAGRLLRNMAGTAGAE